MSVSQTFAYDGLALRVDCPDQAHLAWLREFLLPAFVQVDDEQAECTVTLEINDRRHDALLERGAHPTGAQACGFVLDRRTVDLTSWSPLDSARVFFDEESAVFFVMDPDAHRITILSRSRHLSRRVALMRVVRELIMSAMWSGRRCVLHAAACTIGARGIVIAGPKGAGKTTLLMYLLGLAGAQFVANDRLVVDVRESLTAGRAMPTVISVREGTLRRFPAFAKRWKDSGYCERLTLAEARNGSARRLPVGQANLTPAQFCALLDVSLRQSMPVTAIVFPRLTARVDGIRLDELSPTVGARRIEAGLFAAAAPRTSEVFALPSRSSQPDLEQLRESSRVLIARSRCFDVALGPASEHTAEALHQFVDTLGD